VPAGGRSDECSQDASSHAITKPNTIVGELELAGPDLKVSWETDCGDSTVTFTIDAKATNIGWLAVGLIDGGDSANPLGKPGNSMSSMDVVMMSPAKQIQDSYAQGYHAPKPKSVQKAVLVETGVRCGGSFAKFKRDFKKHSTEVQAFEIKEKSFVYMCAAYNAAGQTFSTRHTMARAYALKISLFGGVGESYKTSDSAEPEPEPEPESEAEAEANKPIHAGDCAKDGYGTSMKDCWAFALNAGVRFAASKDKKTHFKLNYFRRAKSYHFS